MHHTQARDLRTGDRYRLGLSLTELTVTDTPTHDTHTDDDGHAHETVHIPVQLPDGARHVDELGAKTPVTRTGRAPVLPSARFRLASRAALRRTT